MGSTYQMITNFLDIIRADYEEVKHNGLKCLIVYSKTHWNEPIKVKLTFENGQLINVKEL